MKFCKDCKHNDGDFCRRVTYLDPVSGNLCHKFIIARVERTVSKPYDCTSDDLCGMEAKHFEPKPPAVEVVPTISWWRRLFQ